MNKGGVKVSLADFEKHCQDYHMTDNLYICNHTQCEKVFTRKEGIEKHLNSKEGKKYCRFHESVYYENGRKTIKISYYRFQKYDYMGN